MTEDDVRAAFEAWSTDGRMLGGMEKAFAWDAWIGRAAWEKSRCRYPDCVENEDEKCPRWLTGECAGPAAAKGKKP